jgi:hypothetical protein
MLLKIFVLPLAFLISFALSFLSACDKEPDNPDTTTKPKYNYVPLEVGNWWIYKQNWNEINNFDTMSVTKDSVINNSKYFLVRHSGLLTVIKGQMWLQIDHNQNIWFYDQTLQKEILIISLNPLSYVDTLEFEYYRLNRIRKCISKTNKEETLFNTIVKKVTINDYADYKHEFYFANNIGIIYTLEVNNEIPWELKLIDTSERYLLIKSCINGIETEYSFR